MNEDFIRRYASETANLLRTLDPGPILAAVSVLYDAWNFDRPVLFCGNGGSGASCSHIVNDLQKNIAIEAGKPLRSLCLNDCVPLVSAWANDTAWHNVFAPQIASWGQHGGVLVAVSGSGKSANIIQAILAAKNAGMVTVGLTGFDGGWVATAVDHSLHVPTDSMQHAEDVHLVILHMLYLGLVQRIKDGAPGGL